MMNVVPINCLKEFFIRLLYVLGPARESLVQGVDLLLEVLIHVVKEVLQRKQVSCRSFADPLEKVQAKLFHLLFIVVSLC